MQAYGGALPDPWDLATATWRYWDWASRAGEAWWTRLAGPDAVRAAQARRLASLVAFARARSPLYRDACAHLPAGVRDLGSLPVMHKADLMQRFDDWLTDPALDRRAIEAFLRDRSHVGEAYLGRYVIWKSSGSTGEPGIFVQDDDALATFDALMSLHLETTRFAGQRAWNYLRHGGRAALVVATGDHFASIASWKRLCRTNPGIAAQGFSILDPLPTLVDALNDYQPAMLASYPTMLALLADEQRAGRLRLSLTHIWSGGECLAPATGAAVERAFGCRVINEYGASECMSIAFGCGEGWLHVNADWVILEPVDRAGRATRAGEPSHTVLLTNLANRVQPIIRYDLGDSVVAGPGPCPCGSMLPRIRVEGRRDDVVALRRRDGVVVRLLPLALTTVVEECAHLHRFQIVQSAPDALMLRIDVKPGERAAAWQAARRALHGYLARQSLHDVTLTLDTGRPVVDPCSGKLREVVVDDRVARRPVRKRRGSAIRGAFGADPDQKR